MVINIENLELEAFNLRKARKELVEDLVTKNRRSTNKLIFFSFPIQLQKDLILSTKWLFNGFILVINDLVMLVDPGAELLTRVTDLENLLDINTIFISHGHLDHYASVNIALEYATIKKNKEINILAPKDVFFRKLISDYHSGIDPKNFNIKRIIIKDRKAEKIFDKKITPIALYHKIDECYGFILENKKNNIGFISDTGYSITYKTTRGNKYQADSNHNFENFSEIVKKHNYIKDIFRNVDILIVSLNDLIFTKHSKYHMTAFDLIDILSGSKVKNCFILNLYPKDLKNLKLADKIADYVTQSTKINTISIPESGLTYKF